MATRGIIFDFGGVFSLQHESLAGFSEAARRLGRSGQELYDLLYSGEDWRLARIGQLRAEEYWRRMMGLLGLHPDGDLEAFLADMFSGERISQEVVQIARLLRRNYPLVLLSNALDDLEQLLVEKYRIAHLFDAIVNSAVAGVAKPDPRAYQLALEALALPPEETLFIDDKQRNILAAQALGIPSILYTTPQALVAELLAQGVLQEKDLDGLAAVRHQRPARQGKVREHMTQPEINDVLRTRMLEAFKDWMAQHHGDHSRSASMENATISRDAGSENEYIVQLDIPESPNTVRARVTVGPGNEITVQG